MLNYRIIAANDSALRTMGQDDWQLICISDGKMYFSREEKRTRAQKKAIQTPEYLEFREKYPSKTGIYDDKLIKKYNELVSQGLHAKIMHAIEQYDKERKATGQEKICNASTFLNQKRWMQEFKVTGDRSEEWVNRILEGLSSSVISKVMEAKKNWEAAHPTKQLTEGILMNMVEKFSNS